MKSRYPAEHFMRHNREGKLVIACRPAWLAVPGIWGTTDWKRVTCKKCLKNKEKYDPSRKA